MGFTSSIFFWPIMTFVIYRYEKKNPIYQKANGKSASKSKQFFSVYLLLLCQLCGIMAFAFEDDNVLQLIFIMVGALLGISGLFYSVIRRIF